MVGSISVDRVPQDARARANLIRTPQQEFGDEAACGLRLPLPLPLPPGPWIHGERLGALVESTCVRVGHGEDANPAGSSGTLPARDPDAARRDRRRLELELATGNSCASAVAAIGTSQMGTNCSNHVSLAEYQSSYGFLIIVNHY
jgi:hypothetical protein